MYEPQSRSRGADKGDVCAGVQPTAAPAVQLSPEDDPHTIHIFTVASGHMYERLQKIMILSVIRNTRYSHSPFSANSACIVCKAMMLNARERQVCR